MNEHAVIDQVNMDTTFWIATAIFLLAYAIIISEKVHKTIIALFGAGLILILKILEQKDAFYVEETGIDWNVIFLLISMMIIINIMRPTGFFEYLAIKSAKVAKGEPMMIMIIFCIVTATVSAFLDNVTTVLLIAPVTISIAHKLKVDPIPYLIAEALASNVGGTATLIGDPPNIMIGSKADLGFMPFVYHLTPGIIFVMVGFLICCKIFFAKKMVADPELKKQIMAMDEKKEIKDQKLLNKCLAVLVLTLVGFVVHGAFHLEPATIAMFAAGTLLLISGTKEPHRVLAEVEWPSLFFFMGLFIIIGATVKVGLIRWLSIQVLALTHKDLLATSMVVLWFSAFLSAIIDNIPYVATMNPLIIDMAKQMWPQAQGTQLLHHPDLLPIWWSLSLGACLGGNGTAIGASANVIVVGMSEKMGHKITFIEFMKYGMPIMIVTVFISMIYIWLRYYVLKIGLTTGVGF